MENNNNHQKEPQDSVRKKKQMQEMQEMKDLNQPKEKSPEDNVSPHKKENEENNNKIIIDEENQKIKSESIQEAVKEKSKQILNFSNELDNILASILKTWENYREGFQNYYLNEIRQKFNELLNYPCVTMCQEKVILIFKFFCKYLNSRQNCLKIIPTIEIDEMYFLIVSANFNIFSLTPNCGDNHNYELIDDRYFYQVFKELLPTKEVENYYGTNKKNCMYKYFIEFLFQCGYMDSYIDNILTRDDINPYSFSYYALYPLHYLLYCEKEFLKKKNYSIRIIRNYNAKIDFYLSDKSPYIKGETDMFNFAQTTTNNFINSLFGVFNHVIDEMIEQYAQDCNIFTITVFKISEFLLKHPKINMKMAGIHLCSLLCHEYLFFYNKYEEYKKTFNDIEKIYNYATKCAVSYLNKIKIFDLIFGENIHEGLIQRSYPTLSFLYRNHSFTSTQIQFLWNLSITKYQSISDSIITLFSQLLPEFTNEDCNSILNIVSNMNYKEVNETTLKLLENFCKGNERRELLLNILYKFSNELSYEKGLKKNIIIKSREILVKLLFNNNYKDDLIKYIKLCISYINEFYLVNTYSSSLSDIFDHFDILKGKDLKYIYKSLDNKIEDLGMMISYLDDNCKLFPIYMNYLVNVIKMFKFFYAIAIDIVKQINEGNFEYQQKLDIDNLYNSYINYTKKHMNYYYSLNNETTDDENSMDIDFEICNNSNGNLNNRPNINKTDYANYIKNIIKDYVIFFKQEFLNIITPSYEEVKKAIFEKLKIFFDKLNFNESIHTILKFIYANHVRANIHFKISYLNFLYNVAQNLQDINPSMDWYYGLLSNLFSLQIQNNNNNYHLLDDANLEYLLKEHILKKEYQILPQTAFTIVNLYTIYINLKTDNTTYSPLIQKYTKIKDLSKFEGFENIWRFYLLTKNQIIHQQSLNVLMNILELVSQDVENRNKFISKIFNFIENNKNNFHTPEIKTAFIRNLKLISVANGTKFTKKIMEAKEENNSLELNIKNCYFSLKDTTDNNVKIKITKDIKIKDLKEYIINNIICTENNLKIYNQQIQAHNKSIINEKNNSINNMEDDNTISTTSNPSSSGDIKKLLLSIEEFKKEVYKTNISINYKNKVLQDGDYTLADYKVEKDSNLLIYKGEGYIEKEYKPTDEELKAGFAAIKDIFGDNLYFNEEVMRASIIKNKGNPEEAALFLTNEDNVKNLEKEIEDKKKGLEQNDDEIMCLEEDKVNLLIEILSNNNDEEISSNIWQLFSEIKYPENVINKIIGEELGIILNESNYNKLLLYLKLINSLVFDDNFCKFNKIKKEQKNQWISNFIKNENIIKNIFSTLFVINEKLNNHNHMYQIINIFINWLHKIILKVNELIKDENLYANNALETISKYQELNSQNNVNINNKKNENNNKKESEEFEITNKDEGKNFIRIIYEINGAEVLYKLLFISISINIKPLDKQILIDKIYEIILIYLLLKLDNIQKFSQLEKKNNILIKIICNEKDIINRLMTHNFIKALIMNILRITDRNEFDNENFFFNILVLSLIKEIINGKFYNEQFYQLLGNLLFFDTTKLVQNTINPLIYKLLNHIYDLCSNFENNINLKNIICCEFYILSLSLKFYKNNINAFINKLLTENKDFVQLIYNCLFEISRDKNRITAFKFTDHNLRLYSFNLLTELIKSDKNYLSKLIPKVLNNNKKLRPVEQNGYQTPFDVNLRSPNEKLVGLRNFGATCYLNSLFQQMFMIPSFRNNILSNFEIKYDSEDQYKYSVIYNMQITFQNLISGWMSPYPPLRFIKSFLSAFNEQPITLGVQQDSDEFLAILCDNLEKEAKIFGKEKFLENCFKGKISNEILSLEKEFPYYSQSEEPFYRITLDIKGHKSLEEALDAYVKGETLDGDNKYYVEKYKRKISICKSNSIKKLGNEVIIHLKRFEYDFYTFTNNKLNDYIKFPQTINLKKWTRAHLRLNENNISKELLNITKEEEENLIDENMDYILTGILVHGGSSLQSGHYYSFIIDQETGQWHQFNDNKISDYNIERDLEKDCFGNISVQNNQYNYSNTAYLLFYTNKKNFRNKELLEKINTNEMVLNDVFNENVNFLNMYIYTDINYFNFIKEFSNSAIELLDDEMHTGSQRQLTLSNYLKKEEMIYYKVLSVIKGDTDDNDSIDENDNNENNITKIENFEQIYNKCRDEIEFITKEEKKDKKSKNYTKKSIIKLYFNYLFGTIIHQQNNQKIICQAIKTLNDILEKHMGYSLWILKQIEKHIDIFTDILFKYGTMENEMNEVNKSIFDFFNITFNFIYSYEKENLQMDEKIKYFIKNDKGNYIIAKEHKSIIMRLIRKLFCEHLEKSRIEYAKNSLFLIIFYNFVKTYPDISSVCVNYLQTIISLITNNTLSDIKSEANPNYLMGSSKSFHVNDGYIMIFCDIILHCATPGMENVKQYSPYFTGRRNQLHTEEYGVDCSKYPQLPPKWEKMLSTEFFLSFVLFHNCSKSKEVICHLCYCDEKTSVKILSLVNEFIRSKNVPLPFLETVFNNAISVFDLNDALEYIRVETLFQLNIDESNNNKEPVDNEQKGLLDYYYEERENNINLILYMLYNIAKAIDKYGIIRQYFEKYKDKIRWVKYFFIELESDPNMKDSFLKNNTFIMSQHPDLIQVIKETIIKKFGFDAD